MLTKQDLINIKALIMRTDIKGEEALGVAQLVIKLDGIVSKEPEVKDEQPATTEPVS
jgi:hypothetical protein